MIDGNLPTQGSMEIAVHKDITRNQGWKIGDIGKEKINDKMNIGRLIEDVNINKIPSQDKLYIYDTELKDINEYGQILNISITMPEKGIVGFTGPSGAGKSTIIYTPAGLMIDKWTGTVSYNNYDYKNFSPDKLCELRKKNFGFVLQKHFLIPYLNVFDNVLSIVDSYEYSSVAQDYLDRLGICHTKDKMISE